MSGLWTIGELALEVERALASAGYPGQKSGRVRSVPDARTIRYYTTIGLLDKPAEMRGRTAYYGRRHLLQLVAIKRLQTQGRSLIEIQAELAGAGDASLERVAALPREFSKKDAGSGATRVTAKNRSVRQDGFWAAAPKPAGRDQGARAEATAPVATAFHVKLLPNVTLMIEGVDAARLNEQSRTRLQPAIDALRSALDEIDGEAE